MNVNLQTCDSCFKSETPHLSCCSIKIPLPALSGNEYALFSWILCNLHLQKERKKITK